MPVRFAVTANPVLAGPVAGVTATVSSVLPPASRLLGVAAPTPLRLLGPCTVSVKLSTASPSSAPVALESVQRIQNVAPAGIERVPIVLDRSVLSAAVLPSFAPVVVVS